jgi:hypothetical protein
MKHSKLSTNLYFASLLSFTALPNSDGIVVVDAKTYHPYCSKKEEQATRRIPGLKTNTPLTDSVETFTLKHVTAVIRHGSRTPWSPHQCWDGYLDPTSDTSTWECTLTSMMRPQSEEAISLESLVGGVTDQATAESGRGLFFEFEKLYDANWSKDHPDHYPSNMGNDLRGNCLKGQLIMGGHLQQVINGQLIQQAYVKNSNLDDNQIFSNEPDVGVLFDFIEEEPKTIVNQRAYDEPSLYFRSDDDERTLMSGQFLLEQLFGNLMKKHEEHYKDEGKDQDRPVIRVHTSDRDKDVLAPNYSSCPRIVELEEEAVASSEYKDMFVNSDEAKIMKLLAVDQFGESKMQDAWEAIDCVMTTHCEDKTLPYVLDVDKSSDDQVIIDKYGEDIFHRYVDFNIQRVAFLFKYKKGIMSKISTNPLWNTILEGLLVFTDANEYEMRKAWPDMRPKSKFSLYSAHDTTIMSMLASLGSDVYDSSDGWPPYASMINIELFDIKWKANADEEIAQQFPTNIGFRLLYNGQPITHHISGCSRKEEICDIDLLVLHVFPFSNVTEWGDQCKRKNIGAKKGSSNGHHRAQGGHVVLMLMGGLLCGVIGAFLTFMYMTRTFIERSKFAPVYDQHPLQMTQTQTDQNGKIYGLPDQQVQAQHHDII